MPIYERVVLPTVGVSGLSVNGDWQHDNRLKGLVVVAKTTEVSASANLVVKLEAQVPPGIDGGEENSAYTILATAAISASGITSLRVSPGAEGVANAVSGDPLPSRWRVTASTSASSAAPNTVAVGAYIIAD